MSWKFEVNLFGSLGVIAPFIRKEYFVFVPKNAQYIHMYYKKFMNQINSGIGKV